MARFNPLDGLRVTQQSIEAGQFEDLAIQAVKRMGDCDAGLDYLASRPID